MDRLQAARRPRARAASRTRWRPRWLSSLHIVRPDMTIEVVSMAQPPHRHHFPAITGNSVWDAGMYLAHWISQGGAGPLVGRRCIELGAGLGLVGLSAACCGATVFLTDLAANVPALQENCRRNASRVAAAGGAVAFGVLDWDSFKYGGPATRTAVREVREALGGPAEVILGADLSWCNGLCESLLAAVLALAGTEGDGMRVEVILAHTSRHGWGRAGAAPEGASTFSLGPPLERAGFKLVSETPIGDADSTYIFRYIRGEPS
mmetsp:Transcript_132660/g.369847  ORF Transcript_132660/g.369847 Transcript_132660/m.369847 type:complete len:263 (-) Transcript_132660:135-923(-)